MQALSSEALPLPATPKGVTKWGFIYVKRAKAKTVSHRTLSRPYVDACVLAFLRNCGNWNTQAHTGRIVVDYATHSKNLRVSDQLEAIGRQRIHVHVTGDKTQK